VDVYLPGSGGAQIHDLNPSQFPPVGLFWTVPIPVGGVQIDLRLRHTPERNIYREQPATGSWLGVFQSCLDRRSGEHARQQR
jgi:hypothetical protein